MRLRRHFSEIGNLADVPQQFHRRGRVRQFFDRFVAQQLLQNQLVVGFARANQPRKRRAFAQAVQQSVRRCRFDVVIAPIQPRQRFKAVFLDSVDDVLGHGGRFGGDPERAVGHVASRPSRDLRQLGRDQHPHPLPVEFAQRRKADVFDL